MSDAAVPEHPDAFTIPAALAHDLYGFLRGIATWQATVDDDTEARGSRLFEALGDAMYPGAGR